MKEGFFFERLFSMFDRNNDGQIVFTEFVKCLGFMTSRLPSDERLHCKRCCCFLFIDLFRFYDLKQDNEISRDELKRITEAMFFQYGRTLPEELLNDIVEETFRSLNLYFRFHFPTCSDKDQSIGFDAFCQIPNIGDPLIEFPTVV